jgi:hypothetical protein
MTGFQKAFISSEPSFRGPSSSETSPEAGSRTSTLVLG